MSAKYSISIPQWLDRIFTSPLMLYRRLKFGYTFRRIHLGDGIYTIVDVDVFYRLGHHKWNLWGSRGKRFYAVRNVKIGYGMAKQLSLHREIMNDPKGVLIDHKNLNSLDNRLDNLRTATQSQNGQNKAKRKNTSSRFIGVSFNTEQRKWRAYINYQCKGIFLGYFKNEIDAARAYDAAARKYYGPQARVNFAEPEPALTK